MTPESKTLPVPGYFGPQNSLFGWIHPPSENAKCCEPVVICSPVGFEQVRTHKTIRRVAETLANRGHLVVRFDYPSAGDSADLGDRTSLVEAWLDSIRSAIDHAQALSGQSGICLLGIRLGGTLAALVAEETAVSQLILWEPVDSGNLFCREMQIIASATRKKLSLPESGLGIEVAGFVITPQTEETLRSITLGHRPFAGSPPILLLQRDDVRSNGRLSKALSMHPSPLDVRPASGYRQMMLAPQDAVLPVSTIGLIERWLDSHCAENRGMISSGVKHSMVSSLHVPTVQLTDDIAEQSVLFGPSDRLFGVLTRSRNRNTDTTPNRPVVITLCGGDVPHFSANRMYVPLARQLASIGYDVLRMDLSGIGDSLPGPGNPRNSVYSTTSPADIECAMDAVARITGARRFVLFGMCSGAYAAMQTAKRSSRIDKLILVNQLVYHVSDDDLCKLSNGEYPSASSIDYPRWTSLSGRIVRKILRSCAQIGLWPGVFIQHRLVGCSLGRELRCLSRRVPSLDFVFSEGDAALDALSLPAGNVVNRLIRSGLATIHVIPNSDHIFSPPLSQEKLINYVVRRLNERPRPS